MCFILDKKHPDKKIAKRNITCYKVLGISMKSPYQGYQYKLNEPVKSDIGDLVNYNPDKCIHEGLHSHCLLDEITTLYDIYKAIIPKGSEYYYNSYYKEYVSNQLIIKEKIS